MYRFTVKDVDKAVRNLNWTAGDRNFAGYDVHSRWDDGVRRYTLRCGDYTVVAKGAKQAVQLLEAFEAGWDAASET